MRLLEQFKDQLKTLEELRYVWFTSFNINIEFIESYLLPAVLGMDPPKNRLDYEYFQLVLNEKGIDFRVFCDKRFMEVDNNKRTSIPVHGVSTTRLNEFSKDSLFHPKVIYLEDVRGNRILGAGSANLTLSGWGRNQEVFIFNKIVTRDQQNSVKHFFDSIMTNVGIDMKLRQRNNLPSDEKAWSFVHSFQSTPFLDQLFNNTRSRELMVWSPYLSSDLAKFIEYLKNEVELNELTIHLVPDRVQGQYIRTAWSDALKCLVDNNCLNFYDNPTKRHERVELCHSKIWKLGSKLAIGSWNFTTRGSNLRNSSGDWNETSNIEAGVIISESTSWQEAVGNPINMNSNNFASTELLEEEGLEIPELLPFDIEVVFDWREQHYTFNGIWNEGKVIDGYAVKVPDISNMILMKWRSKQLHLKHHQPTSVNEMLTERRFELLHQSKVVYRGLITEINFAFRRAQRFESLGDLLDAYVFYGEPDPDDDIPFHPSIGNDNDIFDGEIPDDVEVNEIGSDGGISFFRLFQATHQYVQTLSAINSVSDLNSRVFTQPGCLLELVEKTTSQVQGAKPSVLNWFLANEVKSLCLLARKRRRAIAKDEHSLPKTRWNEIDVEIPLLPEDIEMDGGYVEMVMRECSYATS